MLLEIDSQLTQFNFASCFLLWYCLLVSFSLFYVLHNERRFHFFFPFLNFASVKVVIVKFQFHGPNFRKIHRNREFLYALKYSEEKMQQEIRKKTKGNSSTCCSVTRGSSQIDFSQDMLDILLVFRDNRPSVKSTTEFCRIIWSIDQIFFPACKFPSVSSEGKPVLLVICGYVCEDPLPDPNRRR